MAKISRNLLREFIEEGFFDTPKSIHEVVEKLDTRGFTIKPNKKGLIAQLLTFLCREGVLERTKNREYKKR